MIYIFKIKSVASRKHAYIILTPLKPQFYIVKLGFIGVYIIFHISAQKHRLCASHNLCFEQKYEKYQSFLSENYQFLDVNVSIYLNRRVFVMVRTMIIKMPHIFGEYKVSASDMCFWVLIASTTRSEFCGWEYDPGKVTYNDIYFQQ